MMSVHWGSASHRGRVRSANEDSMFASASLFVVADGMGGHAAGEVASRLAVEEFRPLSELPAITVEDVRETVGRANDRILLAAQEVGRAGMGTTLTGMAVVVADGWTQWAVFNVGDSRTYRFADGHLVQLTVDHSEVQELVDAGQITPDEAARHPLRNVVTRSLGLSPAPVPDIWVMPPAPGERFLLCSDGLTRELSNDTIRGVLQHHPQSQDAAGTLVADAVEAGGRDNVTAVVVDLVVDAAGRDDVDDDTAPRTAVGLA